MFGRCERYNDSNDNDDDDNNNNDNNNNNNNNNSNNNNNGLYKFLKFLYVTYFIDNILTIKILFTINSPLKQTISSKHYLQFLSLKKGTWF